jgi:hypothetical protein
MSKKATFIVISIYQYLMVTLATLLLLIFPFLLHRQYFDLGYVDILVRFLLWLYFVGCYWTVSIAIKNGINQKKNLFFVSHKSNATFLFLGISACISGAFLSILTKWFLSNYYPELSNEIVNIVSFFNGITYAMIGMSQYYFLPKE